MKRYVYKNHQFNGYEITVSGAVYKRVNGSLRRIKVEEAATQVKLLIEHRKRQAGMAVNK